MDPRRAGQGRAGRGTPHLNVAPGNVPPGSAPGNVALRSAARGAEPRTPAAPAPSGASSPGRAHPAGSRPPVWGTGPPRSCAWPGRTGRRCRSRRAGGCRPARAAARTGCVPEVGCVVVGARRGLAGLAPQGGLSATTAATRSVPSLLASSRAPYPPIDHPSRRNARVEALATQQRQELVGHHGAGILTRGPVVPVRVAAVDAGDGERRRARGDGPGEEALEAEVAAQGRPVVGAATVQDDQHRQAAVGAGRPGDGPATAGPEPGPGGQGAADHRAGGHVRQPTGRPVQAQVTGQPRAAGQVTALDPHGGGDQGRGRGQAAGQDGAARRQVPQPPSVDARLPRGVHRRSLTCAGR